MPRALSSSFPPLPQRLDHVGGARAACPRPALTRVPQTGGDPANRGDFSPKSGEPRLPSGRMLPGRRILRRFGIPPSAHVESGVKRLRFERIGPAFGPSAALHRRFPSRRGLPPVESGGWRRDLPDPVRAAVLAESAAGKLVCAGLVRGQARAAGRDQHGLPRAHPRGQRHGPQPGREMVARRRGGALRHPLGQQIHPRRIQQSLRGILAADGIAEGGGGPPGNPDPHAAAMAIYLPNERLQLWQTGRSEDKIRAKVTRHPGVEIDILRQYVVLFGWIKGLDAVETADQFKLEGRPRAEFLARTTSLVTHELWQKGYRVVDMKPAHIILRPGPDRTLLRDRNGQFAYALVDYELLERTTEHERAVRSANRQLYLKHMARRFEASAATPARASARRQHPGGGLRFRPRREHRRHALGGGQGSRSLQLLPARTLAPHAEKKLSSRNQVFSTRTKDNINLVWKVSRMGTRPGSTTPRPTSRPPANTASTALSRNSRSRSSSAARASRRSIPAPST